MISVEQITVEFSGRRLLDGITFLVNSKDKIGLVGRNGSGKSTLLKLIAKADKPSSGKISAQDDVSVGYLPQHMIHNEGTTVMEETEKAFDKINLLQDVIDNLTKQMSDRTDYESDEYSDIINKLSHSYEDADNG